MKNRRFFKKTLAGIASVAMLAGMVPADFMVNAGGFNPEFTWITEDPENVSVKFKDGEIEYTLTDTNKFSTDIVVYDVIDYTLKDGYYVVKTMGEDYSVAESVIKTLAEAALKEKYPNYNGDKLIYGDVYDKTLAETIEEYYEDNAKNKTGSKYFGVACKIIEKCYRTSSALWNNVCDECVPATNKCVHILSECLPDNKIKYTAVVWNNNIPYTGSVTVKRPADENLNELHKPDLSTKKTGEDPECVYEYYECENCGEKVDEFGQKIYKYDDSYWHRIDETNAKILWDYTDTSNPKATINYMCKNEKTPREFTISYKQCTGEEPLGEGMSFTTGKELLEEYLVTEPLSFPIKTDEDNKYIVGPYNILAKIENKTGEAACEADVEAVYDATFYMYRGQRERYEDEKIVDCYTSPKTGKITFNVAKTGHSVKEGTKVEAKEPTDIKGGNYEFYLCKNDNDEGTLVVTKDDKPNTVLFGKEIFFVCPDEEIGFCYGFYDADTDKIELYENSSYTYNFATQCFESKGKKSIFAIPDIAYRFPKMYGYELKNGMINKPDNYVEESTVCGIYPHYAFYHYNNQYIIERTDVKDYDLTKLDELEESLEDSSFRKIIPEDEAKFDEFGNLEQAHIITDGECEVREHNWDNNGKFKSRNKYVGVDESSIDKEETTSLDGFMLWEGSPTQAVYTGSNINNVVMYDKVKNVTLKLNAISRVDSKWIVNDFYEDDQHKPYDEVSIEFSEGKAVITTDNGKFNISDLVPCVAVKTDDPDVFNLVPCEIEKEHYRKCTICQAEETHKETGTFIPTSAGHYVFGSTCEFEYTDSDGNTQKCGIENTYKTISELFNTILNGEKAAKMYNHNWVDANAEYLVCADCGYTKKNDAPSVKTTSNSISLAELDGKEGYRQTYSFDINSNGKEIAYYGVVYNKDTKNIKGLKAENLVLDNKGEFKVPNGYKAEKRTAIKNKGTLTVNLTSDSEDKYVTVMGYVVYKVDGKYEIATTEVNVNTFEMKAEEEFDNACSIKLADNVAYDATAKKFSFKYDIETSEGFTLVKYGCMVDKEYDPEKSKIEESSYDTYQTYDKIRVKTEAAKIKANGTYTVNVSPTANTDAIAVKAFITVTDKYGMVHTAESFGTAEMN